MSEPITRATLDWLRDRLLEPRPVMYAVIGPGEYERWQSWGDGTHCYLGFPPERVQLSPPIGYWRSEYAARCWWLMSEWHR